jgi:hypothetical protein
MVRREKYHLRDLIFNELHRHFGEGLFAVDLDFLEFKLEGNSIKLAALIEVKNEHARLNFSRLQHRAQKKLANLSGVPYITVKYLKPDYKVLVYPMNGLAKEYVPIVTEMSLVEYAQLLYKLRGLRCPDHITALLENHHIHDVDRQYKLNRLNAMEKEIIKLKKELGINGYGSKAGRS